MTHSLPNSLLFIVTLASQHATRTVAQYQGWASSFCVVLSLRPSFPRELDVPLPDIDYMEIPVDWWDAEADKSLLIGVFKHGVYFSKGVPFWISFPQEG